VIALRAAGIGKAYRLYQRPVDSLKELLFRREYAETFWALRDVTLEVPVGGSLGIVGDNGAGKSTLLRLLAGASAPTVGTVERHGLTSAMLSLGAGFHPDLSGRDNIRIGCAVLGLSSDATEELLPAIEEFSELGEFLERPVRTYSSGMQLRLGFSVATAVDPEILVVDEHLSVGDQHFRHKCMRRIQALREKGCALVFCSHDLYTVGEVCDRTLWLRGGQPAMLAATPQVIEAYQDHVRGRDAAESGDTPASPVERGAPDTYVKQVTLGGDCVDGVLPTGGRLAVAIELVRSPAACRDGLHVGVLIVRNDGIWCYGVSTKMDKLPPLRGGDPAGCTVHFTIDALPLLSGAYQVTIGLLDADTPHLYDAVPRTAEFTVRQQVEDVGVVRIDHHWTFPG
jgi:lipopolysaccharide transport system ATP-binding protein